MDFVKRNGLDETAYDPYYMIPSAPEGGEAIIRWKNEIHNDFAARMQWSITPDYSNANHHPLAAIGKDISTRIVNRTVKPGERVTLNAEKSYDPTTTSCTSSGNIIKSRRHTPKEQ